MKPFTQALRLSAAAATLLLAGAAHAQTYQLNMAHDEDPDTVLQSISVTPKATRATILLKNSTKDTVEACSNRTGSPDAFTLTVLDTGEVLQQTAVSGLTDCQVKMDTVRPGKRKTLQITFPPLPAGATHLELGENSCQPNANPEFGNWCFRDIALPKR